MRAKEFINEMAMGEMALPADWDESMFGHDKTFKSRLQYALERAPRLGGGSSRVAFIIPDNGRETVLKVAKNKKGIAQNEAEVDILTDGYVSNIGIVIPIIDFDKKNRVPTWLQTEKAEKASEAKLCKIMKCGSLSMLVAYAEYQLGKNNWRRDAAIKHRDRLPEQDQEIFLDYAQKLAELATSTEIVLGDFGRAANWGLFNGKPVVIDVGYTKEVEHLYWG